MNTRETKETRIQENTREYKRNNKKQQETRIENQNKQKENATTNSFLSFVPKNCIWALI